MSATYNYTYKRWSLRGVSDLMSVTAMPAMTTLAYERMAAAEWLAVTELESDLPPHQYSQTGFLDAYDAAKYCGDYALGKQKAYACAACYSIKLPAEAQAGTKAKVEAILASVYGDRWLAEGAILSAFLTASDTPPAWATIVETASPTYLASSLDPAPAADAVTDPDWDAPLRRITRANVAPDHTYAATITAETAADSTAYLHVVIRLSDYISVPQLAVTGGGTRDSAWIEGGAKIDGTTLAVTFNRAVTADSPPSVLLRMEYPLVYNGNGAAAFGNVSINAESRFHFGYVTPPTGPASIPGDRVMMLKVLGVRDMQSLYQISSYGAGATSSNSIVPRLTEFGGQIGCVYEDNTTADQPQHSYRLHGLFLARSGITGCETVDGISFVQSIPAMPAGQVVRVAMYLAAGPIPFASNANPPLIANIPAMETAASWSLVSGIATSVKLGNTGIASPLADDAEFITTPISVSVSPLGHYDIIGPAGISANTKIPFFSPVAMPRFAVVFVAINVIDYTAAWVAAPATTTAVAFQPTDINLHVV